MANFSAALAKTLKWEGGYSNRSTDRGLETIKGVSRVNWPNWEGWKIVDKYRSSPEFPDILLSLQKLNDLIVKFYKENFWDKIQGDNISDQPLANKVFDIAVNCGVFIAVKELQKAIVALRQFYIAIDGRFGPKTLNALNLCDPDDLLNKFRELLEEHYRDIVANDPEQKVNLNGWLNRLHA